jgi:hypothetical protein
MADMHALNVKDPDIITRVTEEIDTIINFVAKIIERGWWRFSFSLVCDSKAAGRIRFSFHRI